MIRFGERSRKENGERLRPHVTRIEDPETAVASIAAWAGDARIVLLGESTHGTHEFYELRARLTRRLIEDHGFRAVAIEGDWPDAYRVNRFVQGLGGDPDAETALEGFTRFPRWMWRNLVVRDFVSWLRERNLAKRWTEDRAGFYGLDLYSLNASMHAVVDYLAQVDPEAARQAGASYSCFEEFGGDTETYAWASRRIQGGPCEDVVVRELLRLREKASVYAADGARAGDEFFSAEQNARLARNAERYYRTLFHGRSASWNVRDRHMAETLDELVEHLRERGTNPKVVVWAHNSHVGDARATEMGEHGELTLGQLARERHGSRARLIGFSTYDGTVTAAGDWEESAERRRVRPGLERSYEEFFHETGMPGFFVPLVGAGAPPADVLPTRRLQRAIGVVYRPETERQSHYFHTRLAEQFDGLIHLDHTRAIEPLEPTALWEAGEVPELARTGE